MMMTMMMTMMMMTTGYVEGSGPEGTFLQEELASVINIHPITSTSAENKKYNHKKYKNKKYKNEKCNTKKHQEYGNAKSKLLTAHRQFTYNIKIF